MAIIKEEGAWGPDNYDLIRPDDGIRITIGYETKDDDYFDIASLVREAIPKAKRYLDWVAEANLIGDVYADRWSLRSMHGFHEHTIILTFSERRDAMLFKLTFDLIAYVPEDGEEDDEGASNLVFRVPEADEFVSNYW